MSRQQKSTLVAGTNGVGKTTKILNIVEKTSSHKCILAVLPDDEEKLFHSWKELLPNSDEASDEEIIKAILRFRLRGKGNMKIFADNAKIFILLRKYFKHGVLILDDARVICGSRDEPLRKMYMRRRQMNCDIYFICHGLSEVPPSSTTWFTDVILFETTDEFDRWTIDNKEQYLSVVHSVNEIARTKNKYHCERIILKKTA